MTGELQIPQEALYKKNVLLVRGRFNPFTNLHNDMLLGAANQFFCQPSTSGPEGNGANTFEGCVYRDDTLVLLEITTKDMMEVRPALPSFCRILTSLIRSRVAEWYMLVLLASAGTDFMKVRASLPGFCSLLTSLIRKRVAEWYTLVLLVTAAKDFGKRNSGTTCLPWS